MSAIYDLLDTRGAYNARYMHKIPAVDVVDRASFLLGRAKHKNILDIGASGPMSAALKLAAREYHSVDIQHADYCIDLDSAAELPEIAGLDLVIAGEVLEHLSNAGHFLGLLRRYTCPIILTAPNAHSSAGRHHITRGIENVNLEHVAWYSYYTLAELIRRYGYRMLEWHWYNGQPYTAEGLIFVIEVENA